MRTFRRRPPNDHQRELSESLQFVRSEAAALSLLQRHLDRVVPGATATVSEAASCLSARLGREHARTSGREPLLECSLCGSTDSAEDASLCVPAIAAGEAIDSVLARRPGGLTAAECDLIRDSVACAAPVLANLRTLELLEMNAATDALTGLPNSRALRETLKRMIAQAGRTVSALSVILLDLDHLGRINDVHGHERGDDALAAVGETLSSTVRASDYVGRYAGEQFLVLLPDTDRDGAMLVAEKLRGAIGNIRLPGVDGALSASFGVASLPAESGDADALVRLADRALYAAKTGGRNRVEAAGLSVAAAPLDE